MSVIDLQPDTKITADQAIVNDFAITVATVNGSGSQTANSILMRSLFTMGIPVSGKNLFPSNIKGLPTWYTIRASKDGYIARRAIPEIVIAYNEASAAADIAQLPSGGVCILNGDWHWRQSRDDITYYEVPVKAIMDQAGATDGFRVQLENMTYVGAAAQLFGIPLDIICDSLGRSFPGREDAIESNMNVARAAFDWAAANFQKSDPYYVEPMEKTAGQILITGNTAAALGAIFGGVNVIAWYPITPSTSLIDTVISFKRLRRDPKTNKNTIAIIQSEDELAAAGMIIGAGWAGARAMTATSGPGLSLMAEFAGLAYFAEIPCVIWNVTRMGPSTGLPTRTSQGDLLFAHFLGHGDTRQICLLPATPKEAFEFGWKAFNIADQAQTLVLVLSDLDLGMNSWVSDPFDYPDEPIQHGKVLDADTLQAFIGKHGQWGRYLDVDGDGIAYRTLPGTNHPRAAYFTRGTGHDPLAVYSEKPDIWKANLERLRRKMETARQYLPRPIVDYDKSKKIGFLTFGTTEPPVLEARDKLAAAGIKTNYLRVRALPLHDEVFDFVRNHKRIYAVENNFDGQLRQIICLECRENTTHVQPITGGDGLPMAPGPIVQQVLSMEGK